MKPTTSPSSPSPRAELVRMQRALFARNARQIRDSVRVHEPDFARYERRYRRAVASYQRRVSVDAMLARALQSDIVYVGDYHTCAQSQRSFLRVLKACVGHGRDVAIALEFVHARAQSAVDAYLAGVIDEATFVHRAGLKHHWIFDLWPHFRPIFEFAKYHGLPIFAVDAATGAASLAARDRATGERLVHLKRRAPDELLFVLIGDLHLAPQHLPAETSRAANAHGISIRECILYQNSEQIYWQLARAGQEHATEVVQIRDHVFCRMHTPPVVCQQSYLNWLEHHDDGEIDFADAKAQFMDLVERIAAFVRVSLPPHADDLTVYSCGDFSFLARLAKAHQVPPRELSRIRKHVLASESYLHAAAKMVYLGNLSLNHAGEEAAHYVKTLASGVETRARSRVDAFYANVLHECLGFFGSKLVSHQRKCAHPPQLRALVRYLHALPRIPVARQVEYVAAEMALRAVRQRGLLTPAQINALPDAVWFAASHSVGYMLGDRLFYAVMSRRVGRAELRALFDDPWRTAGDAQRVYLQLYRKLRGTKIPARM